MKLNSILAGLLMALVFSSCGKKEETNSPAKVFRFTAIPDQDSTKLKERFGKFAEYLSKELNMQVEYIPVKDYSSSVLAFKNNDVQLAWFGGLSGVQARASVEGSQAIAQGEKDPNFWTYFIAHSSTGLEKSEDFPAGIAGKTFTFGSKGSTSGRLMPEYFIRENMKKAPEEVFKKVGFSGDHSKTLALVADGAYEVGALNYKVWKAAVAEKKIDESKVKLIWSTPGYPDYNWSIRGDVDKQFGEGFLTKVQNAIINLSDEELLKNFSRKKFIKADNSMYQPIVDTGKKIGILD